MGFGSYRTCIKSLIKHAWTATKWARCLNFGLMMHLPMPFFECANSEGSGDAVYKRGPT